MGCVCVSSGQKAEDRDLVDNFVVCYRNNHPLLNQPKTNEMLWTLDFGQDFVKHHYHSLKGSGSSGGIQIPWSPPQQ